MSWYNMIYDDCQRDLLSSSLSAYTYLAVAWHWVSSDTRACHCLHGDTHWLLQRSSRHKSENNHQQATVSVEYCLLSCLWHPEVWPRTRATDTPASQLQVGHADSPVSARQSASVPVQLLYPGRPSHNTSASTLDRRTSSADRSATSSLHLWSSGIRCRWSDDVHCSAMWSAQQPSDNRWKHLFSAYHHVLHIKGVSRNALYKSILLTNLLINRDWHIIVRVY